MKEAKRDWSVAVAFAALTALAVSCVLFTRYSAGLAGRSVAALLDAPDAAWETIREGAVIGRVAEGDRARYLVALPLAGQRVILAATLRQDAAIMDVKLIASGAYASFGRRLAAAMSGPGRAAALSYSPVDRSVASVYQALSESLRETQAQRGPRP